MHLRHPDDLAKLNTATKYPSIPTFHELGERGILTETPTTFTGDVILTEKVDGCLTSDTRVSMADGTRKRILKVEVGDEVLGMDEHGRVVATTVTNRFNNGPAVEWMKVKGRRSNAGRGSAFFAVRCTPNHRFWLPEHRDYRAAEDLAVGDRVLTIRSELQLAPVQSSVLLGKLLGDGHLARSWPKPEHPSNSASVIWGHRAVDSEYVEWTLRALGNIASPVTRTRTSGHGTEMRVGRSAYHPSIASQFGSMTGPDGKKYIPEWVADAIDPIALAFWYMDDGSLSTTEGQEDRAAIATNGFTEEDCKVLLRGLGRLGINGTLMADGRGYLTIRLGAEAAERLFLLVAPYIPPAMQRKLPHRYRGHDGWLPPSEASFRELLVEQTIEEIERNATGKTSSRWDIETGTHNFFANGVLVHNSNARIILMPDGDWFIGSREELLTARDDRVWNPALGIVEALRGVAYGLKGDGSGAGIAVFFLETYGAKIGGQAKQYTGTGRVGWRMFDLAFIPLEVLDWDREQIASWRESEFGQPFATEATLQRAADAEGIELTPRLATIPAPVLPVSVAETAEWLGKHLPATFVGLDEAAGGRPEGIVLRTPDRRVIAKARFEDYARTLRAREPKAPKPGRVR